MVLTAYNKDFIRIEKIENKNYGTIRILPNRWYPEFKYVFTCKKCGGHNYAAVSYSGFTVSNSPWVIVCSHCGFGNYYIED